MSLFNTNSLTVDRAQGSFVDHQWVDGAASQFVITGTIQPIDGEELKGLDIGRKTEDIQCLITNTELFTAKLIELNPGLENYKPDIVTDDETGLQYEVVQVWNCHSKILPHFEYLLSELKDD